MKREIFGSLHHATGLQLNRISLESVVAEVKGDDALHSLLTSYKASRGEPTLVGFRSFLKQYKPKLTMSKSKIKSRSVWWMKALPYLCILFLATACDTTAKKHHTSQRSAPSVEPVKGDIRSATTASEESSRHISSIKKGTDRVDYKAGRALQYFR